MDYCIEFWEDKIRRDEAGEVTHHPLNGNFGSPGKDVGSYGYLTFGGHDLDKSPILNDVKIYHLDFFGETDEVSDREEWADPLRAKILSRLTNNTRCWYLSMIDGAFEGIGDALARILKVCLEEIEVKSENPLHYRRGFLPRLFFEVPNHHLIEVVRYFWSTAVPGYPIEGYCFETKQLDVLRQWNERPRDDLLFREMIDRTFINFYTFPEENRYFVFVTNKVDFSELSALLRIEELKEEAIEMGRDR